MLILESWRFLVLGEVSFRIRTLPNRQRNRARTYYFILYFVRFGTSALMLTHAAFR